MAKMGICDRCGDKKPIIEYFDYDIYRGQFCRKCKDHRFIPENGKKEEKD